MLRFKDLYKETIVKDLQKKFNYSNVMEMPKLVKVSLNMGVGEAVADSKALDAAVADLTMIAGQKPVITVAKKSISTFKLRKDVPIGCKVTLRQAKMYDFLERLVMIALPRLRDFRGFSAKSFDGQGNFSLGIKDHIIFPEINYDKVYKNFGLDINIVTTAKNDEEAKALLAGFYLPFKN